VPAVVPHRGWQVKTDLDLKDTAGYITSHVIVNPSDTETAHVLLHGGRRRPDDDPVECKQDLSLPPRHRISKFINELLPGCDHGSSMKITSDIPIAVATFDVFFPDYKFIPVPDVVIID